MNFLPWIALALFASSIALWKPSPHSRGRFRASLGFVALWLVLWGSLAYLALQPATRAPKALGGVVSVMASGQPGWLASLDNHLGMFLNSHGPAVAVILAVVLALVAVGVYLPRPAARAGVVLAIVTAAVIWAAEGLGGILTGGGTDPNSGLLLALLALAYWPLASAVLSATGQPDVVAATQPESPEGA